jgi:uncharacterized protein (TIGR02265 family)
VAKSLQLVQSYLDQLPGGIDAHPECMVKASVVRNAIIARPLGPDVPLPRPIRAIATDLPSPSTWVPEVHFNAVMLAIREAHFHDDGDAFLAWGYDLNRRLFSTALYRVIFFVVTPERLLPNVEKRWGTFRRGTTATVVRLSETEAELRVESPAYLYTPLTVQGMAVALRAALACAGAKNGSVEGAVLSGTSVVYRVNVR